MKKQYTLKGSRTPAACLEGKHDNRFTISVYSIWLIALDETDYSL